MLVRLRQAVNHPYLVVYSASNAGGAGASGALGGATACAVCHEGAEDAVAATCGHTMCRACARDYVAGAAGAGGEGGDAARLVCPAQGCGAALSVDLDAPARPTPPPAAAPRARAGPPPAGSAAAAFRGHLRADSILRRVPEAGFKSSTKVGDGARGLGRAGGGGKENERDARPTPPPSPVSPLDRGAARGGGAHARRRPGRQGHRVLPVHVHVRRGRRVGGWGLRVCARAGLADPLPFLFQARPRRLPPAAGGHPHRPPGRKHVHGGAGDRDRRVHGG